MYLLILTVGFVVLVNLSIGLIAFAVAEVVSQKVIEHFYVKEDIGRFGWLVSTHIPLKYTRAFVELFIIVVFATCVAMFNLFIYSMR